MEKTNPLGTEAVGPLLRRLALPAIFSQLVNVLYSIVDRIYIGHIPGEGAMALTGVGVTFPALMLITAFSFLIAMGAAPRAGIAMGRGDMTEAEKILGNAFSALLVMSLILTAFFEVFTEPVIRAFGGSHVTMPYAKSYLVIYAAGTVFVQMTLGLNAFITTQGFAKKSMQVVLLGAVLNIVLDPVLIYVCKMGVRGAAMATVISQGASAFYALSFLVSDKAILRLRKVHMKIEKKVLFPCIGLGFAPFVMTSTESLLAVCFNASLLKYGGDVAVGAMTILASVSQLAFLPIRGITQGGQPILSYNLGAGNLARVKETFRKQTLACLISATAVWGVIMIFPGVFCGMFTEEKELFALSAKALRVYMGATFLMGLQISCQQTFIAFGNAKTSAFLAIFRKIIVLIPLIFILPHFLKNKVFAVFFAEPLADTIAVLMTTTLFRREFQRVMSGETEKVSAHVC